MQDLASLLSDILSYMTVGWRSRSRSVRWLVRGVTVVLVVVLVSVATTPVPATNRATVSQNSVDWSHEGTVLRLASR